MEGQRKCRMCGCTDDNCRQCIEKTGEPCHWVEADLCSACKTTVVSFVSIKGGTGKTHTVILLARYLAAAGLKVLLIDSDLNNSLGFHFIHKDEMEKIRTLNIAAALGDERNNLCDYAVPATTPGIDIIASTPYLADLRTLSEKRLKRMINTLYGKYDICLIDCPPTYDNIILNAVNASDCTITPVLKDTFSYNAVVFLSGVLPRDAEDFKNWYILINGYERRHENARTGRQYDFLELYREGGFPMTPQETWFPWTAQIHFLIDYRKKLTRTKLQNARTGAMYNPELFNAVSELASCFIDVVNKPEEF